MRFGGEWGPLVAPDLQEMGLSEASFWDARGADLLRSASQRLCAFGGAGGVLPLGPRLSKDARAGSVFGDAGWRVTVRISERKGGFCVIFLVFFNRDWGGAGVGVAGWVGGQEAKNPFLGVVLWSWPPAWPHPYPPLASPAPCGRVACGLWPGRGPRPFAPLATLELECQPCAPGPAAGSRCAPPKVRARGCPCAPDTEP